ncbi:MAG TPA: type II toxin-antitoxin system HicA family toxin [Anaerolineales bacterium]|nr:type II toxin-antitoxin system HicA family toxin [Anaerolineales bacterium]
MSQWRTVKARQVLAALLRIGWRVKRQSGSHRTLERAGWPDFVFAFHDNEEIGPRMLARLDPDSRTVSWPNGADFAPDFLYHLDAEPAPPAEPALTR